jgi:hypothetical protein
VTGFFIYDAAPPALAASLHKSPLPVVGCFIGGGSSSLSPSIVHPKHIERKYPMNAHVYEQITDRIITLLAQGTGDPDSRDEQHTKIKDKIRAEAESLDYTVSPGEVSFPEVHGRADIVLERGKRKIIGQVTVTTPVKYEVESIEKFLKAGVTHIAVISTNRQKLYLIQRTLEERGSSADTVGFYSPSEFNSQLFDWAADDPNGGEIEKAKPKKQPIDFNAGKLSKTELEINMQKMLEKLKNALKH